MRSYEIGFLIEPTFELDRLTEDHIQSRLNVFRSSQQVHMAGTVLFDHILDVVRLERLLELSSGYKVFDL